MSTRDLITSDLKDAMRARDQKKLVTLRSITAAIKQIEVDERIVVEDSRILIILDKLARQRKESITQFEAAGRDDLVAQEQYELEIIRHYLPQPLSESEINNLIQKALTELHAEKMADMGKVMAYLKPLLQGRADMSQISLLIKNKLS